MSYPKFIAVRRKTQTYRYVEVGVYDSSIPESGNLSELTLYYIDDAINQLNFILTQPDDAVLWGVEQFHVESEPIMSVCLDFNEEVIAEVSTVDLKNLMLEVKNFKEYCQQSDNYKTIIGQAFSAIKSNPSQYRRWPESDLHYITNINDVSVSIAIEPSDLDLTTEAFINQLNIIF
ncbi:hypothetical protein [Flavobacterium daejeonense]|uniref:hypothetical protein n=1 Tax=Flavobacterium daejeonense TaxID=350893 RepID=UPI00047BC215|nr:hypothetical protein [Flavobacterium daejeonense]